MCSRVRVRVRVRDRTPLVARLMIVRGLPGSGKSTYASRRRLEDGYVHVESDMFFMVDGEYRFDGARLSEAHAWCLEEVTWRLMSRQSVVVSNTFTTMEELQPYLDLAAQIGLTPTIVHCVGEFETVHGVPVAVIECMRARWEPCPGERVYRPRVRVISHSGARMWAATRSNRLRLRGMSNGELVRVSCEAQTHGAAWVRLVYEELRYRRLVQAATLRGFRH